MLEDGFFLHESGGGSRHAFGPFRRISEVTLPIAKFRQLLYFSVLLIRSVTSGQDSIFSALFSSLICRIKVFSYLE